MILSKNAYSLDSNKYQDLIKAAKKDNITVDLYEKYP